MSHIVEARNALIDSLLEENQTLLAEVKRLRARLELTPEKVERAAKACAQWYYGRGDALECNYWYCIARAALLATLKEEVR